MSTLNYYKHNPYDPKHGGADQIVDLESKHILAWRGRLPRFGLALSGGGIRSASYCLGVLQAMANEQVLEKFDYLSTVSGGGYIGTSMSYLLHETTKEAEPTGSTKAARFDTSRERFPYLSYPMVSVPPPGETRAFRVKGRLLHRLRENAKYLTPGARITLLSLLGAMLRNVVVSVMVHVAVLLLVMQVLISTTLLPGIAPDTLVKAWGTVGGLDWPEVGLMRVALGAFILFWAMSLLYLLLTAFFDGIERRSAVPSPRPGAPSFSPWTYRARRGFDISASVLLAITLALVVAGALPSILQWLATMKWTGISELLNSITKGTSRPVAVGGLSAVLGVIGSIWGVLKARSGKKPRVPTKLVVVGASALLLFGALLLVYLLALWLNQLLPNGAATVALGALVVLLALGWWPDANYMSLHRHYRDRLMELFMPDLAQVNKSVSDQGDKEEAMVGPSVPGDQALLGQLCGVGTAGAVAASLLNGPYHIVNANVVLVASKHPRYRARGGDNFILSPLFCGCRATGWQETERQPGKGMTAATAMAISGAALNPNAGGGGEGITRQPLLSVLMGMLNLRLGFWFRNPNSELSDSLASMTMRLLSRWRPNMLSPGLAESFARKSLNEHEAHVLLTDGGHFENLGLYELVRRRLEVIVVCDAAEDKEFKFNDLANAIEKVRTDFGAIVKISSEDLAAMVPRQRSQASDDCGFPVAERGYLIAPVIYSRQVGEQEDSQGVLIYFKATFFKQLSADLYGYRRAHADFPNQPTGDQFFDEKQFEGYRELGFATCCRLLEALRVADTAGQSHIDARALTLVRS